MIYLKWPIGILLIFCWQQIQVKAFFNITLEALNVNHVLMKEVETTSIYKNKDEWITKLNSTTDIWLEFMEKFINEEEDLFEDVFTEAYDLSMTLQFNIHDFLKHLQSLTYKVLEFYENKTYLEKSMYYWYFTRPSSVSGFIAENDYNLYTEEIWKDKFKKIHELLFEIDLETGLNVVDVISNTTVAKNCKQQSRQQMLFNMLRLITITDAKGFVAISYAYAIYKIYFDVFNKISDSYERFALEWSTLLWSNKDMISKMKEAEREFIERNTHTIQKFKTHIISVSRNVWNCDTMKDTSYTKMERVFQKYIINEVDLNQEGTCTKDCSFYSETKVNGCYNQNICARQRVCDGTIRNCNDNFTSAMNVCLGSKDENSRYKYIKVEGKKYGNYDRCDEDNAEIKVDSWPRGFYKCSYCMCICENSEHGSHRYFNLRPATSNINLNYVITGARFQKENGVIHIQIQQAQLLPNGLVNSSTAEWKPVDNYTINSGGVLAGRDYHTITWNERTLLLDELDSPITDILTGLRFKLIDGSLKLEIRVTNFNFTTGILIPDNSRWHSKNAVLKDRTALQLDNFKDDITPDVKLNHYLRFTTSTMEIDAGQNTAPFIDITSVTSRIVVPLSGAGIFIKNDDKIGSFLSLKLLTYDLQQYMMKI